jgi:hypothetical protein
VAAGSVRSGQIEAKHLLTLEPESPKPDGRDARQVSPVGDPSQPPPDVSPTATARADGFSQLSEFCAFATMKFNKIFIVLSHISLKLEKNIKLHL